MKPTTKKTESIVSSSTIVQLSPAAATQPTKSTRPANNPFMRKVDESVVKSSLYAKLTEEFKMRKIQDKPAVHEVVSYCLCHSQIFMSIHVTILHRWNVHSHDPFTITLMCRLHLSFHHNQQSQLLDYSTPS